MRAVPGSEECLRPGQARAGSGGDSEQLSVPAVLSARR